mgnify:CR=1 FL=1
MLLPQANRAVIDPVKLHGYLLSTSHPIGRFKARFFGALGFRAARWFELEDALRTQHLNKQARLGPPDPRGRFFTIGATKLQGPAGEASVLSVWLVRNDEDFPRFVTAYPGGDR